MSLYCLIQAQLHVQAVLKTLTTFLKSKALSLYKASYLAFPIPILNVNLDFVNVKLYNCVEMKHSIKVLDRQQRQPNINRRMILKNWTFATVLHKALSSYGKRESTYKYLELVIVKYIRSQHFVTLAGHFVLCLPGVPIAPLQLLYICQRISVHNAHFSGRNNDLLSTWTLSYCTGTRPLHDPREDRSHFVSVFPVCSVTKRTVH